jgi:arylsulfatase A-like enzyme
MPRFSPAALFSFAALLLFSCHREPARPRNVIFILVDTLRADRLGAYGYGRSTSPNLDAFAREAVRFDNARSQASCTFPSVNSILTSRWPAAFLGQPDQAVGIPPGIPSLAEILQAHGYRTVAVSASAVVRNSPSPYNPSAGFGRGFEVFDETCEWGSAACVNRRAALYIKDREKPIFLYLHYLDPHAPYQPPKTWRRRFALGRPGDRWVRQGNPNPLGAWIYMHKKNPGLTPANLQFLKDLYDDEIAFFDARFAELMETIRTAGLLEDSILVFTSDHGEEFLEHGHVNHCRVLFDSSIRVPLLLKIPGVGARSVPQPVQSLDLVPTILDSLGIDARTYRLDGRSLRPLLEGRSEPAGEIQFGLQGTFRSAADGRFKLIQDLDSGAVSLFDLDADPGEKVDALIHDRRAFFRLRGALTTWLARAEGSGTAQESVRKAREAEARLRSLGYIE